MTPQNPDIYLSLKNSYQEWPNFFIVFGIFRHETAASRYPTYHCNQLRFGQLNIIDKLGLINGFEFKDKIKFRI